MIIGLIILHIILSFINRFFFKGFFWFGKIIFCKESIIIINCKESKHFVKDLNKCKVVIGDYEGKRIANTFSTYDGADNYIKFKENNIKYFYRIFIKYENEDKKLKRFLKLWEDFDVKIVN